MAPVRWRETLCSNNGVPMPPENDHQRTRTEEFKLDGGMVLDKIKELIRQGNIRRIILKNEEGKTLIEIPLTVGVVGVALPVLAAVGALAAVATRMTVVVEKTE
jgi:hypothetical protein